jgi:hypothetical protein
MHTINLTSLLWRMLYLYQMQEFYIRDSVDKPCYGEQCCMLNTQNAMSLITPYNPWLITG